MKFLPLILSMFLSFVGSTRSNAASQIPDEMKNAGITEKLGSKVPAELRFIDSTGKPRVLSEFLNAGRPVVLSLVYFNCPNLCTFVLNGLVDTLKKSDLLPGRDFEIVSVSINHREKPELAAQKKTAYLNDYGKPEAGAGWHFLTGDEASIRSLADSVGFGFRYDEQEKQYAHSAALMILTPEGILSRYLYGIEYRPKDFRLAIVEASKGMVGTVVDRLILFCYRYDAHARGYSLAVTRLMKVAAGVTVLLMGAFLFGFWRKQRSQQGTTV